MMHDVSDVDVDSASRSTLSDALGYRVLWSETLNWEAAKALEGGISLKSFFLSGALVKVFENAESF
jgi:hypothetical protein